jgi:type I restriction enzyme S subunit
MAVEWDTVDLEQIANANIKAFAMGPFGSNIKKENYRNSGIPVIRGNNLNAERFSNDDFVFLTTAKAEDLKSSWAYPEDIVFVAQGTIGSVGIVPKAGISEMYVLSQNLMKFSCDPEQAHPLYVFYYFRSHLGQHEILSYANPTGVPCISQPLSSLRLFRIPLPPLPEQRAIAHILGTLDDKIELNRQMNETLEAKAQTIFKSWFVDFDPVRAKSEGRDTGLPPDIAALFPSEFQDSELGPIPKGWKVKPLFDMIDIIGGGTPKTIVPEYWNGNIPWFSVVDAPMESDVFVVDTENHITQLGVENSSTKILREGTTIISARGTVGKCALAGHPMAMNQSCYGIQGKDKRGDFFIYYTIRHQVADLQRSGHGSVFNTITRDTFRTIPIASPTVKLTQAFDESVRASLKMILNNLEESTILCAIRDQLLQKLLSGELRIQNVSKFVEGFR